MGRTDGRTDRRTDRPTDTVIYRSRCPRQKCDSRRWALLLVLGPTEFQAQWLSLICPLKQEQVAPIISLKQHAQPWRPQNSEIRQLSIERDSLPGGRRIYELVLTYNIYQLEKGEVGYTRIFFYKHKVHKHTQPQIWKILSTLLSTPPASDFEIDNIISEKLLFFPKFSEKNAIFSKISEQ